MLKIDRSKIREYFNQGLKDKDIADKLNCKAQTIFIIRSRELHLYKRSQFYLQEWRRAYFNKAAKQTVIYIPKIMMDKLNFNQGDDLNYKLTFEAPNRLILDFKKNVENVLKRRWSKSTINARNAENQSRM